MTDMIERVARAICAAGCVNPNDWEEREDGTRVYAWQHAEREARAAIEAMREPDDGMIEAGRDEFDDEQDADFLATHVYRAMIDAALMDKEPTP